MGSLLFLIPMLLLFYAMLVRPQRRQVAAHQALVASLSEGDDVVTVGGMFGTVRRIDDAIVDLEVAPGTTIRVARSAVSRKISEPTQEQE
jgi:preprotein translocase subunit YajC